MNKNREALDQAGLKPNQIDGIAYTKVLSN